MNNRQTTWQNQGKNVQNSRSIEEVLRDANLNFEVEKHQLKYNVGEKTFEAKNKFAAIRKDQPDKHFGIVSRGYQICQNQEAFDFINNIQEDITFEQAGITRGGIVYVIASMAEVDVLGDKVKPHLIFQNGFNGFIPLKANVCMLRIACNNQFNYSFKNAANAIKIKHCGNMEEKLQTAKETIQQSYEYIKSYKDLANNFAGRKVNDEVLQFVIKEMLNDGKPIASVPDPRGTLAERVEMFKTAYRTADNSNFRNTAWGIVNAWTDFSSHLPAKKSSDTYEENRFISNTFDSKQITRLVKIVDDVTKSA